MDFGFTQSDILAISCCGALASIHIQPLLTCEACNACAFLEGSRTDLPASTRSQSVRQLELRDRSCHRLLPCFLPSPDHPTAAATRSATVASTYSGSKVYSTMWVCALGSLLDVSTSWTLALLNPTFLPFLAVELLPAYTYSRYLHAKPAMRAPSSKAQGRICQHQQGHSQ